MDKTLRNTLRNVVTQCRRQLEEAVAEVLEGQFGIYASGKVDDAERMEHLSADDREYREQLLIHLQHVQAASFKAKEAVEQLVREVAFTHLNRFCAYKMMEHRGLIRKAVSDRLKSQGFLFYLADHPDEEALYAGGQQDVAYQHFLEWLGSTLSKEIGVLFSPHDPANRLLPTQRVLDSVLDLLNSEELKDIWGEDETIGWVYQYFTPKELRDKARKESQAPRNSYELAFRNQFYTPSYVVQFLTDNTLGRIWYEMRKGETALKEQCKYFVRRPNEVFLAAGEEAPTKNDKAEDLSQEELLKQPIYITHRPKKDPRSLKILDPACGSGHFLLYCFNLLLIIYEEAYDDPELGSVLQRDYSDLEAYHKAIPGLILAHNLHGIDIDIRATQIAALALWLRAQKAYQEMGIDKKKRPKITKSHIVCAEPMPGEKELLDEFVDKLQPKVLGQLVQVMFNKMQHAGEAGSLLKIEEEMREVIAEAKRQWRTEPKPEQLTLLPQYEQLQPEQMNLFDVADITDEEFWDEAEARVVQSLQDYAQQAVGSTQLQRQLFTDDAVQGFAFVDIYRQRFDVVLMNPPFGDMPELVLAYLTENFPTTKYDLAIAFVERSLSLLIPRGRLGWISPRTWFSLSLLESFRKEVLYKKNVLTDVIDLGIGILDTALVETACCVAEAGGTPNSFIFVHRLLASRSKELDLLNAIGNPTSEAVIVPVRTMADLPRGAFGYWFPPAFAKHLRDIPRFDSNGGDARQGLATTDDFRFLRCLWEVSANKVGFTAQWVPFAKGGEYQPYYDDIHLVIDYANDGRVLKEYLEKEKGQKHWSRRISSSDRYGQIGLTYPERTTSDFSPRPLPSGTIFSATGQAVFFPTQGQILQYLALAYTRPFKQLVELLVGSGDASESGSAARDYTSGILNEIPVPSINNEADLWVEELVLEAIQLRQNELRGVEESCDFNLPVVLDVNDSSSLAKRIEEASKRYRGDVNELLKIGQKLDDWACKLYGLDSSDARNFLSDEVCVFPLDYPQNMACVSSMNELVALNMSSLVEQLCESRGYKRAFTKKAYWANRRIELLAHLSQVNPNSFPTVSGADVTRHLATPIQDFISYCAGVVVCRWDIRLALDSTLIKLRLNPFSKVSAIKPGSLLSPDGLPATSGNIVSEEWLRARPDANTLPPEGTVQQPTISDFEYPITVDWKGILVDDPDHPGDIIRRVRDVLEVLWGDRAEAIEQEACEILGVKELRDYFRKPGNDGFWTDHIKCYSKSRRKAPIYWLLQSSKKNYALWIYYHRLDKDILFKALVNYVEPKLRLEESNLEQLRSQKAAAGTSGKVTKQLEKQIDRQEALLCELHDFQDKLHRAANLNLEPDLNDGVVLNIAPLWELVPWSEAKKYWEELTDGKYEWSSIGKQLRAKGIV